MASYAKAQALVRDVADKLSKRYANSATINTVRQANDAQGWPMLFLSHNGNEAEGQAVIAIRIKNIDAVSKDVFGNALTAYAPHTCEIAYELNATARSIPTPADLLTAEFEAIKTGVEIQLKTIANGTAVSEASLNAAAVALDIQELYWPTKSV